MDLGRGRLEAGAASAGTARFKIAGQRGRVELPSRAPVFDPDCPFLGTLCDENAWAALFLQAITVPAPLFRAFDPYAPLVP